MELELSENRVSGTRYHTVNPNTNQDPYRCDQGWLDMENWCIKTFGPTPVDGVWTPNARWYVNNSKFWFRSEADLHWFLLRWQ